MVQVRKGLCCWGLRELIGHPPFLADWKSCRWRSNCTGAWLLMPCSLGPDCPASHISAQPVWGYQGDGREEVTETAYNSASGPHMGSHGWGVVKEGGETLDLPSLGRGELPAPPFTVTFDRRHLTTSGESKQTPLIYSHFASFAQQLGWAGPSRNTSD